MFADDDVDEEKNDIKKKKTDENFRERDDIMCVLSFFLPVSSVFCFCCLSSLFLFVRLIGLSNEENSSFWYDFTRVVVNVNVVVTKKNSFAFVQKQGRFLTCKTALSVLLYFPGFFPSKDPVVFARFDDAGERVSGLAAFAVASIEQLSVQRPVRVRL